MTTLKQFSARVAPAFVVACLLAAPSAAEAQLDYNRTIFAHGFGSSSAIWNTPRLDLGNLTTANYVAARVDLGAVWTPNWPAQTVFDTEWHEVRDSLLNIDGRRVIVGHSLGGLVARYTYLSGGQTARDRTAAILTVASPHQGTLLADSAQQLGAFMLDLKHTVDLGMPGLKITLGLFVTAFFAPFFGSASIVGLLSMFFVNFSEFPAPSGLLQVASLPAARTVGAVVSQLNNTSVDAAIPRANIFARMEPTKFMPLRLLAAFSGTSEQSQIDKFQKSRSAFNTCKWVMAFTVVGLSAAQKCSNAERMMGRLDETWQRYLNGSSSQQRCGQVWSTDGPHYKCWMAVMPNLNVASDGVVTNSRSVYPGQGSGQFWQAPTVDGANHMTVHRQQSGVNRMIQAMLIQFRMRVAYNPPPPSGNPPPPSGPSASINGTSSIAASVGCSWSASVSGGAAPYTYLWMVNGSFVGDNSPSVSYENSGSAFTISVMVTDQNGVTASADFSVSIDPNSGCY